MYQNILTSIIDRPLASEAFAITAERRAAIQDEMDAFERYPKPSLQQFGGGGSIASVVHGRRDQTSLSDIAHHESANIGHSSYKNYEKPQNICRVPKDMVASKVHQSQVLFEENPHHQLTVSGPKASIREPCFGASSLSILESNCDINRPIMFGSDPVIDGPLLPNSKVKPKHRYELYEGGRAIGSSIFYVPLPAQIDHMRSIFCTDSFNPSRAALRPFLSSASPRNLVFELPMTADSAEG